VGDVRGFRRDDRRARAGGVRVCARVLCSTSVLVGLTAVVGSSVAPAQASAAHSTGPACQQPVPISAAAASSTTGVTGKSVTVGNVSIVSGPVPGLFEGAPIGVKAYFAYVNAKGGTNGRKLYVDAYDDAFSGQQNATETQQAVSRDFALVGNFSLFDGYGCKVLAQNSAVPDVSVTIDQGTNNLANDFSAQPLAGGDNLGPFLYWKKLYPKYTKVGSLVSNVASAVAQWQGRAATLKHAGYSISYVRYIGPLDSNFTTDIVRMQRAGVNAVDMTALDWPVAADIILDMTQQGWRPKLIFSGGPVYDNHFIKTAGGPSVTNGIYVAQEQALYLGQDAKVVPAVNTFLTWVKRVNPAWTPDLFTLFGWESAQLFVRALDAAGRHPTRGGVLAQLHKITSFNASGLQAASNPAKKLPASCYLMSRIVNGNFQRVDDPANGGFRCDAAFFNANGATS
jgi:ABC-type branched-subunit amino acid transport system substrate-binding protein